MSAGYDRVLAALEGRGLIVPSYTGVNALCPAHEDARPSLSLGRGDDDRALLYCFAGCETIDVLKALGLGWQDIFGGRGVNESVKIPVAQYVYTDEEGNPLVRVTRTEPKGFYQERWEGEPWNAWTVPLDDVRRTLYRLPDVVTARDAGETIYFVEGEKDADILATRFGVAATTMLGGAGKWRPEYADSLASAKICIIADQDEPGRKSAETVASAVRSVGGMPTIVRPASGKDATDHVLSGFGLADFVESRNDDVFEPIDWRNYEAPDDEWLFHPYVPEGARVLLHGPSGALKSLWAMWLAAWLAREGCKVAYFSTEMNRGQTVKRLKRLNPPDSMRVYGRFMLGQNLETAIANFEGYDLLVVDSWSSAQGDLPSNSNDGISRLDTDFFQPLIAATGATVLMIDNTGKPVLTDRGPIKQDTARGASRKRDIQEVELWFDRPVSNNNFRTTITVTKMRLDIPMPATVVVETPQDEIEFYYVVSQGDVAMMSTKPMWPGLQVDASKDTEADIMALERIMDALGATKATP